MAAGDTEYWELHNFVDMVWPIRPLWVDSVALTGHLEDPATYITNEYYGDMVGSIIFPEGTLGGVDTMGYPVGWSPNFQNERYAEGAWLAAAANVGGDYTGDPSDFTVSILDTSDYDALLDQYWDVSDYVSTYVTGDEPAFFFGIVSDEVGVGMITIEDGDESSLYWEGAIDLTIAELPFYRLYYAAPGISIDNPSLSNFNDSPGYDEEKYDFNYTIATIDVTMDDTELDGLANTYSLDESLDITQFSAWSSIAEVVVHETTYTPIPQKIKDLEEITFEGLEGTTSSEVVRIAATTAPAGY